MSTVRIPESEWQEFLQEFTGRHRGRLVQLEMHDMETEEKVISRRIPLRSIELDLEDEKNARINVTVQADQKEIKHIFFRPSQLTLFLSDDGAEEALHVKSINTESTVRFRVQPPTAAGEAA